MNPVVILERLEQDAGAFRRQMVRSCSRLSIEENFRKAKSVFIKPNLTYPTCKAGVTTRHGMGTADGMTERPRVFKE